MGFRKKLIARLENKEKHSEAAVLIAEAIDNDECTALAFYDLILARFTHYDEYNHQQRNEKFESDVALIIDCIKESFSSSEDQDHFALCLDSYFYMFQRVNEYVELIKQDHFWKLYTLPKALIQLRESMSAFITHVFEKTNGSQPNLCVREKSLWEKVNLFETVYAYNRVDKDNLNTFLVFIKLAMQSSILAGDFNEFHWKTIIVRVKNFSISLQDFISTYGAYELAFTEFPLNMSAFIQLVQQAPLKKENDSTPFFIFIRLCQQLQLDLPNFLDQFRPVLENKMREKQCTATHVEDLIVYLSRQERIFEQYLSVYTSYINEASLWLLFLKIGTRGEINEKVAHSLVAEVSKRIAPTSIDTFLGYTRKMEDQAEKLPVERRDWIYQMYISVFNAFIETHMKDNCYSCHFYEDNLKKFLEIIVKVSPSSAEAIQQPSSLLIIHHLLFKLDKNTGALSERMKNLFRRLKNLDGKLIKNNDPTTIISDDWLRNHVLNIPEGFSICLTNDAYKYLSNHHENNRWTIYVWNRLMQLTFLKVKQEKIVQTLSRLDQWMNEVTGDVHDPEDVLTISIVVNLFRHVLLPLTRPLVTLPKMDHIMKYLLQLRDVEIFGLMKDDIPSFIRGIEKEVQAIISLKEKYTKYRDLAQPTVVSSVFHEIKLQDADALNPQHYKFPIVTPKIETVFGRSPGDIPMIHPNFNYDDFVQFIKQVNQWVSWFHRAIPIGMNILHWMKTFKVDGAAQLFSDLHSAKINPNINPLQVRDLIEKLLKLLRPFNDLHRLCHLLNCSTMFQVLERGTVNEKIKSSALIQELKRIQPENFFTVKNGIQYQHQVQIQPRRNVIWALASDKLPCNIEIEFQATETADEFAALFVQDNVPIERNILQGRFETQRDGQLIMKIDNRRNHVDRTIWFRAKQSSLSTCHLFHGTFQMYYQSAYAEVDHPCTMTDVSNLLEKVFKFIDSLLDGSIKLNLMVDLKPVFCDKNINIKDEVTKLFTNRAEGRAGGPANAQNEKRIDDVCAWLQIYQYYSHVTILLNCIDEFGILSGNNADESINNLRQSSNENCSLKDITEAYRFVHQRFQRLSHQHLQLIKAAVECASVIKMMGETKLYTETGRRRFQELRDNLTTQFQLQERNNMILNSWIVIYPLCEPFTIKARNLDDFIECLASLEHLDDSSLKHMQVVNDNIQIVNMWLSAVETTKLDNALMLMEHLYRSGTILMRLQRLTNEEPYFQIGYSIKKIQNMAATTDEAPGWGHANRVQRNEAEHIKFTLSMAEIDDHKRQLTFCNVDLSDKAQYKKLLLTEQLNMLKIVEDIFLTLCKLEMAGHPEYQLKEENYRIYDHSDSVETLIDQLKNDQEGRVDRLKLAIEQRSKNLQLIHQSLTVNFNRWLMNLEHYRRSFPLLTLFSNRQVMILIVLLSEPSNEKSIRDHFLEKLSLSRDQRVTNANERQLTNACLVHYLRSVRIQPEKLSEERIQQLCQAHQISRNVNAEVSLSTLCKFLDELFDRGKDLLSHAGPTTENQQYLVKLPSRGTVCDNPGLEHDLNMDVCCILLNLFTDRLPAFFQILWCSTATEDDIRLFFHRIRTFKHLKFVLMDIDKMHHRLREILFGEQDDLTRQDQSHGMVYYFSREVTHRKGLRTFPIVDKTRDIKQTYAHLKNLIQKSRWNHPEIQVICGTAGIGKTHRINTNYKNTETLCISINDRLHSSALINSFLSFGSEMGNRPASVYLNISIHAPFEELNRAFFSLLVCGSITDTASGLTFSLPIETAWRFFIEVPHTDRFQKSIQVNFSQILPLVSLIAADRIEEVTERSYQLYINEEEELVARFLKAYQDGSINRLVTITNDGVEHLVTFPKLTDPNECRHLIHDCIDDNAPQMRKNKISELSFTKFLYRRVRFFMSQYYQYNMTDDKLGSNAMKQMINEARALSTIDFSGKDYPRIFLVYDPNFSLHLLHDSWETLSPDLKDLFKNKNPSIGPEFDNKDYFAKCLSWVMDIQYTDFMQAMESVRFILTENFAYKLFHIHERKLTKLALIIEGHTGVGKTFLLNFYSLLLNADFSHGSLHENVAPRILERTSLWLVKTVFGEILLKETRLRNACVKKIRQQLVGTENEADGEQQAGNNNELNIMPFANQQGRVEEEIIDDEDPMQESLANAIGAPVVPQAVEPEAPADPGDLNFFQELKSKLNNYAYDITALNTIWKAILIVSRQQAVNISHTLITAMYDYVTTQLTTVPLVEPSLQLQLLLKQNDTGLSARKASQIFDEYLHHTQIKPLFYRLLLHPGVSEEKLQDFMRPICQLAEQIPTVEMVVFFDEVNTSSCLGLFKEMFMDRTLHGRSLPTNIFFTAAINPATKQADENSVHRSDYIVHPLPEALEHLKVSYGALEPDSLRAYIGQKIKKFRESTAVTNQAERELEIGIQRMLTDCIVAAQEFCEENLGKNSVSQREIQRCFNLIRFFMTMRVNTRSEQPLSSRKSIALALALIYYFRLPTEDHNRQRGEETTPPRERLARVLSRSIPEFCNIIDEVLEDFVSRENFVIPPGVAINQAVREHIFAIVISIVTRTPLCIIGAPGQSKTLSFQIVVQNLQGVQLSSKEFCKRLPAIDPFYCLGSKYTRSEDIAHIFDRAIRREQDYIQNRINTRCVVFLDEASLPNEQKMVLKVLHPYLDECKVAFVAVSNKSFDAANANRMLCIYRSLPSEADQKILAYGCLGLQIDDLQQAVNDRLENIISGLCQGYRILLKNKEIPNIYHDRDFIYMLRELRFELTTTTDDQETRIDGITPVSLLRAIEDNFNGISSRDFEKLSNIFFRAVQEKCPDFRRPAVCRNVPTVLRESMKLDSVRRRLYGRYKLVIDESEDESAVRLLGQCQVLDLDPTKITVFRMSDFSDDMNNELRNVEILSTIKLCMEKGKTILMVNTSRIHGSLYDVFNQNFSIMATGDNRKIWSKVAIGAKTIDVIVHEDFQCIVHIKRSEFDSIPAPFLSRFQKYSLGVKDFYEIRLKQMNDADQKLMEQVERKTQTFLSHVGRENFYGLTDDTLYSCLLSFMQGDEQDNRAFVDVHHQYTQLTIKSKKFIEQNPADSRKCLLRSIVSRLIQLVPPESIIVKLPTFEDEIARWICTNYFRHQEHFSLENLLPRFITNSNFHQDNFDVLKLAEQNEAESRLTRKVMIFTRTSPHVLSLSDQTKSELFAANNSDEYQFTNLSEKVDILNLSVIENSAELEEKFQQYMANDQRSLLLIIVNARTAQQRLHIPYVRHLIDTNENIAGKGEKSFLLLVHSPSQTIYHQSVFPVIFLQGWDFYFFDTCISSNAFHLQNMLQILSTSADQRDREPADEILCDLNSLFEDCLWDFCSRIQIVLHNVTSEMFSTPAAHEFYRRQTTTIRRVQCLKQILQQATQFQKRIVNIYRQSLSSRKDSSPKMYQMIYQISKDILCGKRFDGLVDSIQSQTRLSFTNFVTNVLKYVVNDYGLDTLTQLSNSNDSMLNLIDYSSFSGDDEKNSTDASSQSVFQLVTHYACIPKTPLYHLFHQRIKSYAEEIQLRPTTNKFGEGKQIREYKPEEFRYELINSLSNDSVLMRIINERLLHTYSQDLIQTFCTIVEKNFTHDLTQFQKTIEFVSHWLLLVDENDRDSLTSAKYRHVWLLAHVYTSFEYDQNDLFSLYSACRIIDRLDPTRMFYEKLFEGDEVTRTTVREKLYRMMFNYLWENLNTQADSENWILTYTLIGKYYPSEKVLERSHLTDIRVRIDFMNLAYLIFLNENIPSPKELVEHLLTNVHQSIEENQNLRAGQSTSVYAGELPLIIDGVRQYFQGKETDPSALLIDILQWIVSLLRSTTKTPEKIILDYWRYLNEPNCPLNWSRKQFLFDELTQLYLTNVRPLRPQQNRAERDFWDRVNLLLPVLIDGLSNQLPIETYKLPTHSSVLPEDHQSSTLIDLFFFYLKRMFENDMISIDLLTKIFQAENPAAVNRRNNAVQENVFKQIKDYFLLYVAGLLVCRAELSEEDRSTLRDRLGTIIPAYLSVEQNATRLGSSLELFLSTILSKRSWNFLVTFLRSDPIKQMDDAWASNLCRLLQFQETAGVNKTSLQLSHRVQFTLSVDKTGSIFPELHQPYNELKVLVDRCAKQPVDQGRWQDLLNWIGVQRQGNPPVLQLTQIKVMLLLNIYYDYYCVDRLALVKSLLPIVQNELQALPEEQTVFQALLEPDRSMIGYPRAGVDLERNALNNLFAVDYKDEDELPIRHCMINLMAMILLGGKQSFLWTFAFSPLSIEHTFGFGSTAHQTVEANGVHYDCGCVITVNGDLLQLFGGANPSVLNVPAIYVVYFSTYGAMAWHLLLYGASVDNLHGPILAKHAIADTSNEGRMAGDTVRTKVCHFVRARLLSSFHFLSIGSNEDDACLLMSRCFEQMARVTLDHQQHANNWIQPTYTTLDAELKAEGQYNDQVFYTVSQKMIEYKAYINQVDQQSQIQASLQKYVDQLPIVIQYRHFKNELHSPAYSNLPLRVLRQTLDAADFLSITRSIYDLSQFYILLHQTYSFLIEKSEFIELTLEEMHKRGQERFNKSDNLLQGDRSSNHDVIIENGLKAINAYHGFTDGLIKPGACDETQRFEKVSNETMVHYLVTTENHDEGDIVMRILSVLVDYHNNLLDMLRGEMDVDEPGRVNVLKKLVNDLTSNEVSILQIARDTAGVITLSKNDWVWIEQLARTSLIIDEDDYLQTVATQLKFDFIHVQSYFIRTYLLFCRINYRHIVQKYQCRVQRTQVNNDTEAIELDEQYSKRLSLEQVEAISSHLKQLRLDKLYQSHKLLRQIALMIKASEDDLSALTLSDFLYNADREQNLKEQAEQLEIKDFILCHISHIRELYADSIVDFQHLFTDVSRLLHAPMSGEVEEELQQILEETVMRTSENEPMEMLKANIQTVTDLLNELREVEETLCDKSHLSLVETCGYVSIDEKLLQLVPRALKCENYVALSIHLIRTRATLQEQVLNIEERGTKRWYESFEDNQINETAGQNKFHEFLNPPDQIIPQKNEGIDLMSDFNWDLPPEATTTDEQNVLNAYVFEEVERRAPLQKQESVLQEFPMPNNPQVLVEEQLEYATILELELTVIPMPAGPSANAAVDEINGKAQKFSVKLPNETLSPFMCKRDRLFEQLKRIFNANRIDPKQKVVIDKKSIFVDFNGNNNPPAHETCLEYFIVDASSLFRVDFHLKDSQIEFSCTAEAKVFTLCQHLISDHHQANTTTCLCFTDAFGRFFNDVTVGELYQSTAGENNILTVSVTEEQLENSSSCEISMQINENEQSKTVFHLNTEWQQINRWLKQNNALRNRAAHNFAFLIREMNCIVDNDAKILSTLARSANITVHVIDEEIIASLVFTYENNSQSIRALRSMPLSHLIHSDGLRCSLNLSEISATDCALVLGEQNEEIIANEDLRRPISEFLNDADGQNQQPIRFRVALLINIFQPNGSEAKRIPLSNVRINIEKLTELCVPEDQRNNHHLAAFSTNRIVSGNEQIGDLNETKFILVKENEICRVLLRRQQEAALIQIDDDSTGDIEQRFTCFASIADVYRANKIDLEKENLLNENYFVPSLTTRLMSLQTEGCVQLTRIDQNLPLHLKIENLLDQRSIDFHCHRTMTVERIASIAGRLLNAKREFVELQYQGALDTTLSLDDILDAGETSMNMQMASSAPIKASVTFDGKKVIIPCALTTPAADLMVEVLQSFGITAANIEQYELLSLADESHPPVDLELTIEEINEAFPSDSDVLQLEIIKTNQ